MTQIIQRADAKEQNWPPLVCICSLCECGGHKCSDFNDWLAAQDGSSTTPLGGEHQLEPEAGNKCANSHTHSCSYAQTGALEERYLTRASQANRQPHLSGPKRDTSIADLAPGDQEHSNLDKTCQRSDDENDEVLHVLVTRPQVASKPRDNIIFEGDMDLRTTFETSYEALARARLEQWKRHQELKARRQRSRASDMEDVSDKTGEGGGRRQEAASISWNRGGMEERAGSRAGRPLNERRTEQDYAPGEDKDWCAMGPPDDVEGGPGGSRTSKIDASSPSPNGKTKGRPTNATMIKPPSRTRSVADDTAESKQRRRPLVSGPALSLESRGDGAGLPGASPQPPAAALTAEQRKRSQQRRQQDHFIDPDLSPIIVYDANLNRLERVGLRKRSKYRPSTSLRPGGRGFFGPVESNEQPPPSSSSSSTAAAGINSLDGGVTLNTYEQVSADDRHQDDPHREEKGANSMELDEAHELVSRASPAYLGRRKMAAGASSETLNRGPIGCGRKHHLAHVNRIDHIKQMNLVEDASYSWKPKQFADSATSTINDTQAVRQQQWSADDRRVGVGENGHEANKIDEKEDEERLVREEEAAVEEIHRLVVADDGQRAAHRAEPQQRELSSSRQSNRLAKQTTSISPLGRPAAEIRTQVNSSASNQDGGRCSSRQSRMERVCQNQSFYLFENDYPETRSDPLDDKRCVKIGERDTVKLSKQLHRISPLSAYARQNLFRESPDFIMTTGCMGGRAQSVVDQPDQGRQCIATEEGVAEPEDAQVQKQYKNIKQNQVSKELDRWKRSPDESHKCRVLNLGHDFEFVGSKSGHKYFVEKHMMVMPISEMG